MSNLLVKKGADAHRAITKQGALERLVTFAFEGFVYPQTREHPELYMDAPDWMQETQHTKLSSEIARAVRPHAQLTIRTAGAGSPLPGSEPEQVPENWHFDRASCRTMAARDRCSIDGGYLPY